MDDVAAEIKARLSMRQVVERYGFEPVRGGFITCPFHAGDNTPSLKIYDQPGRGFNCFGCGATGSVIDFVMRLFDIPFRAALVRMNFDFGLGLTGERPNRREIERIRRERRQREKALALYQDEYTANCRAHRECLRVLDDPNADGPQKGAALARIDYLRYWFDANPWR